jgi:hypothetical protein
MTAAYEPRWDRDLERGKQGEMFAHRIALTSRDGSAPIEVKTDAWWLQTQRIYVELECFRQGKWRPSGLATTESLYWTTVAGKHELEMTIATAWLRRAVAHAAARHPDNSKAECRRGSHPTRGVYVYFHDIVQTRDEALDEHPRRLGEIANEILDGLRDKKGGAQP